MQDQDRVAATNMFAEIGTFHHLTPEGWVESTVTPAGVVETWRRVATRSSSGKLLVDYSRAWASNAISSNERRLLRDRVGMPEADVPGGIADIMWEVVD